MPKSRRRLNVPGGTYYVVQISSAQQKIFSEPDHYALFEGLLTRAVQRTHTIVLGYCWLPRSVHVVLQAGDVPIGRLLQGFTASYARSVHLETNESGHLFAQRYRAKLVDVDRWLLRLIRYLHFLPVLEGLAARPEDWPYSSHHAYRHRTGAAWLSTRKVLRLLDSDERATDSYASLMSHPPPPQEVRLFQFGDATDARFIGEPNLTQNQRRVQTNARLTVDGVIRAVLQLLDIDRAEVHSSSRRHEVVLARAVIAWHVVERGLATLSEIADQLRRDPSTLSVAIRRYRNQRPELFRLDAISALTPMSATPIVNLAKHNKKS